MVAVAIRPIAFVQNSAVGDFSALERRDGFTATLSELGVQPWVFVPDADRAPFEAGKQAMEALMGQAVTPDAIFFANDNLAAGGLLAGQRAGLSIPQGAPYWDLATTRLPTCCCPASAPSSHPRWRSAYSPPHASCNVWAY